MNVDIGAGTVVLVDTNSIIEAHRTAAWPALAGGCRVETVADCVTETQTGFANRPRAEWIERGALETALAAVHDVGDAERAELALRVGGIALDLGEESLWAHALGRSDDWWLCGPDRASLRAGIRLGFRDRLVCLEELLERVGHRPRTALKSAYTRRWMRRAVAEMVLAETGEAPGRGGGRS
ncbi:MAG: hypothetical protein OXG71_09800 [Rhodospirillales bacterium]|nr:hypothetical protein [Rhodospirillales bacterium]